MDALARVAPVARDVLSEVDAVLASLGAPADHPVWNLLRSVGVTPAAAVDFFVASRPNELRALSASLRRQVGALPVTTIAGVGWRGSAGEAFARQASALFAHVGDDPDSLAGRLTATASYVDDVADWCERSRDCLALVLADVLTSTQVITLRAAPVRVGHDHLELAARQSPQAVLAAADIGAHVLSGAAQAHDDGGQVLRRWAPVLVELAYHGPTTREVGDTGQLIDLRW